MTDIQARTRYEQFLAGDIALTCDDEVAALVTELIEQFKELQAQLSAKDALIAELQKENEWQDIETAPKVDGERIYAIDDRGCEYIVRWTDMPIGGYFDAPHLHTKLTHWRKLPEPPKGI